MRTTPALALVAAFLVSSAVGGLISPEAGRGPGYNKLHRRTCHAGAHHHKRQGGDKASTLAAPAAPAAPAAQDWAAPGGAGDAGNVQPSTGPGDAGASGDAQPSKMHKKKSKGKCALKHKAQDSNTPAGQDSDLPPVTDAAGNGQGAGQGTPASPASPDGSAASSKGDAGSSAGQQPGSNPVGPPGFGDEGPDNQDAPDGYSVASQAGDSKPPTDGSAGAQGDSEAKKPDDSQGSSADGSSDGDTVGSVGSQTSEGAQGDGVHCKGIRGSTTLPSQGSINPGWFSPELIHHGPGTQFGGPGLWQGGACMYDDMPHHGLPSIAMDQSFYQDGLACGTCVEIASTDASLFQNREWSVEEPKRGTLPAGKKTIAIVSDLCPSINQCYSGLDMHLDAWNSVTNNAAGSKLPINWRFVNCKEAFEKSNSGIKKLQVHWRSGASPGFFQVQIRGHHEAVVRVEMKWGQQGWVEATHVDNAWWKWDLKENTAKFDQASTPVVFRITDWQGETITSEVGTKMGKDVFFDANFDRVSSDEAK